MEDTAVGLLRGRLDVAGDRAAWQAALVATTAETLATHSSVVLCNAEDDGYLDSASTLEHEAPGHAARLARRSGGATRWILQHARALVVGDIERDPFGANDMLRRAGIRAYAGVPLASGSVRLGVLYALIGFRRELSLSEMGLLEVLAREAGASLERQRRRDNPTRLVDVLVIDDDEGLARAVANMAGRLPGIEVRTAHDLDSAAREVTRRIPHLVFLDLAFPGATGYEICACLARQWRQSPPDVWFMTGNADLASELHRRELGARGFLIKPFGVEPIDAAIDETCKRLGR